MRFYGLGIGYIPPRIVPCQDSLVESFSVAVRPGMARYGQVFTENLRTSSFQPVSARFQPVFSPFRPLHLCFLRARLRASGASLDRVNHPKIRRNIKIHQGTRHIRLGTQWIYSESVPSTIFNTKSHHLCTPDLYSLISL